MLDLRAVVLSRLRIHYYAIVRVTVSALAESATPIEFRSTPAVAKAVHLNSSDAAESAVFSFDFMINTPLDGPPQPRPAFAD
jgi:hypothetical protein